MFRTAEKHHLIQIVIAEQWLNAIKSAEINQLIQQQLENFNQELHEQKADSVYRIQGINIFIAKNLAMLLTKHPKYKAEIMLGLITKLSLLNFGPRELKNVDPDNYQSITEEHIKKSLLKTNTSLASSLIQTGRALLKEMVPPQKAPGYDQKLNLLNALNNIISAYSHSNKKQIKQEFVDRLENIERKLNDHQYNRFDDELDRAVELLKHRQNNYYHGRFFATRRQDGSNMQKLITQITAKITNERAVEANPNIPPRKKTP